MRPGRELDTFIAKQVIGHNVKVKQKELWEETPEGERPLRKYSRDMSAAWEVMEKMNITLIPVEGQKWFAMVGKDERFKGPAEFLQYLQSGNFINSGAAVGENIPETICLAAIKAIEVRKASIEQISEEPSVINETCGMH
jgi:hypothetical protein